MDLPHILPLRYNFSSCLNRHTRLLPALQIPVNERCELLVSPIKPNSAQGDLIYETAAVTWDEAPMANHSAMACLEEVCRIVMNNDKPFGNKVIVLLGDFRQTCPVIRNGTRAQVVNALIKSSPLWPLFTVCRLTHPIRNTEDLEYAAFVNCIRDSEGPEIVLHLLSITNSVDELINFVYPPSILSNPKACLRRSILSPTNMQIDKYNTCILKQIPGDVRHYHTADTLKEVADVSLLPPSSVLDYISRHPPPSFPLHKLEIKIGGIYRLLRNMSLDKGLVKNVRFIVVAKGDRLITVHIL